MRKTTLLLIAVATLLSAQARAEDPELSTDTKRMLSYGTLAVLTGSCKTALMPAQSARLKKGLEQAAAAQHQMSEADFTEAMKAVGVQVGSNREAVCGALTPEYIDTSLAQAEAGE